MVARSASVYDSVPVQDDLFLLDPPPGFQGFNPDGGGTAYTRRLPHWRQPGATYFVTIRLADSLPQEKIVELKLLRELSVPQVGKEEGWLDQGLGSCVLEQSLSQTIVVEALHYFDQKQYELGAYVVMPNHVHVILRPFEISLERILQSRKRAIAREINQGQLRQGVLWQEESFDRIIRDADHLWRTLQYLGDNPRNANLTPAQFTRWVRPEWQKLGWDFVP